MAAGAASGGAAGGAKHVANVPGQQGLERLGGLGSRELLEQVGQVRGGLKTIGTQGNRITGILPSRCLYRPHKPSRARSVSKTF